MCSIRKEKSRKTFKCQNLDQLYMHVGGGQIQFKFCKFEQSQSKCNITYQFKKTKLLILKTKFLSHLTQEWAVRPSLRLATHIINGGRTPPN
jgi:hypothetical protein